MYDYFEELGYPAYDFEKDAMDCMIGEKADRARLNKIME